MSQRISSPFGTVMLTSDHQDNLFERVFGDDVPEGPARSPRVPAVDVYETESSFVVMVDLPGVLKQDIDVKYSGGMLSISAEAKGLQRTDGHWIMHERRIGRYVRGINLAHAVDPSSISAEYTDGILELTIAKPKSDAESAVEIKVG